MNRSELAARLVDAQNGEREALLSEHAQLADLELAHILKDFCLDGWSSNPTQAIAAAQTLAGLARFNSHPEIAALCAWASGLEALVNGYMERAIESLDQSHRRFLALDKPHAAAATEVSKLIALAMLGHYDEAIACGLRAREVFLAHGDILAAGKIEHNIGNLCFRRDRYHEAEEFQVAARERFMALNDQKQLATINNCLANTHALLHKFKSAEELYEQAVRQAEAAGLPTTLAGIEGNIGNFALLQGRYDRALDYLERSRRRYASLGMPHQSATAEQEIADAYLELNLVPEAAAIYERVIPKFAELGMRAEQARALTYYGRALISLGRSEGAHAHLLSARELYAAEENEVGEAVVVLTQAQLHYQQKDYVSANRMAAEAESRLSFSGGWRRLLMARWLHGEAERALGRTGEARSILEQTLLEANLKEQPQVAERCCTSLGLVAAMAGDTPAAEKAFKQAVKLTEELRAPLPGEEFRTAFFANKLEPYSELVRLCLDDGRVAEALDFIERARSRALAETLGGNPGLTVRPRDEFESDLLRQMEGLSEELNYLYNQINRPQDDAGEPDERPAKRLAGKRKQDTRDFATATASERENFRHQRII
jgi:tetratricopeptide (TPR) repeat protein